MRVGVDARHHPDQDPLRLAAGRLPAEEVLEPVDVVGVVDDDRADPGLDGHQHLGVGLGVAVQDDVAGVHAGGQGQHELATAGDVDDEPLVGREPVHRLGRERLGGERHP